VATGASITGFQRAQMMGAINEVDQPYYCDTDSIVCRSKGTLNIGTGLGEWKQECTCDYGAIAGKKLYAFRQSTKGYKIASKGVRLTAQEIIKIAKGQTVLAENIAPTFSINKQPTFINRTIKMKKELQLIS
jgi:hypothetical protein